MAAAEPGSDAWEGYTLLAHLRDLGPDAIVSLEVRYNAPPPPPGRRRRRRTREPERLERQPGGAAGQLVQWVPLFDHGTGTTAGPHGSPGLIRQLERSRGGAGAFFDRMAEELGHDDLAGAHRFRVYLLGYRGDEGVWPRTE